MRGGKVNIGKAFKKAGRQIKNVANNARDAFQVVARKAPGALKQAGLAFRDAVPRDLLKGVANTAATAGLSYIGQPQLSGVVNKSMNRGIDNAYNSTRRKKPYVYKPKSYERPDPRPAYTASYDDDDDDDDEGWYMPAEGPLYGSGAKKNKRKPSAAATGSAMGCRPCMVKGSQAAIDHMAYLRSMRKSK